MISLKQKQFLAKLNALLDEYNITDVLITDDKISFISCNNELRFYGYDSGTYTFVSTIDNHGNLEEDDYNDGGGIC